MTALVSPMPTIAQSLVGQDAPVGSGVAANVQLIPTDGRVGRTQEYVTAGRFTTEVSKNTLEILTQERDEIQRFMGPRVYDFMDLDAEVNKCLTVLKTYTLSDGLSVSPAVPEQDKENYQNAKWLSDFVTRACNNVQNSSVRDVLEQMLDCMKYGHKVAEKTYDFKDTGPDTGLYLLKYLKVKKQKSIAFAVDKFKNTIGFKVANLKNTPTGKQRIIPRSKFFVITFRGKDSDPRGTSILQAAYHAWHLKMMMWPEYITWLKMCAVPGLVGITSEENDNKNYLRNSDGSPARDNEGNLVTVPATSQLADALASLRNASAIAIPAGSQVTPINQTVSSEPFKTSRDVLNEEIEMSLLLQTLATSDSRHNTRAASQTAMTVLDILVFDIKQIVTEAFRRDVIQHLIEINVEKIVERLKELDVETRQKESSKLQSKVKVLEAKIASLKARDLIAPELLSALEDAKLAVVEFETSLQTKRDIDADYVMTLIPKAHMGDTERRLWSTDGIAASKMYADGMLRDSQLPGIWNQLGIDAPADGDSSPESRMPGGRMGPSDDTNIVPAATKPATGGTSNA